MTSALALAPSLLCLGQMAALRKDVSLYWSLPMRTHQYPTTPGLFRDGVRCYPLALSDLSGRDFYHRSMAESFRVYGPQESTIGDNNDFGVALVTMLPLLVYLFQRFQLLALESEYVLATIAVEFYCNAIYVFAGRSRSPSFLMPGATFWLPCSVLSHKVSSRHSLCRGLCGDIRIRATRLVCANEHN